MKKSIIITSALSIAMFALYSCGGNPSSEKSNTYIVITDTDTPIDYLKIGKELAMQTKANLGNNLITAMSEKGADGAVEFCNIKAIPITDSMSLALGAKIKRVSDQPRNPNNQANDEELDYIKNLKAAQANGKEYPPLLTEIDGKMVGYYAIITNQMCMQCHGKPDKEINTATLKKIKKLYPTDQAIGYAENEIRGIFVVEMNKK